MVFFDDWQLEYLKVKCNIINLMLNRAHGKCLSNSFLARRFVIGNNVTKQLNKLPSRHGSGLHGCYDAPHHIYHKDKNNLDTFQSSFIWN